MNGRIYKLSKDHEIVICSYTIDELKELMKNKFKVSLQELDDFLKDFPFDLVYSPTYVENKLFEIRDKDDYIILHTAIIEDVDVFITGDKDFEDIDIEKTEILTATEFIEKYYQKIGVDILEMLELDDAWIKEYEKYNSIDYRKSLRYKYKEMKKKK